MRIEATKEKIMFEFTDFLKRNKLTISDKDVAPVFKLKYNQTLNIGEYSSLLTLLESQKLLDKEKSINKEVDFYIKKHKLLLDLLNEKL